SSDSQIYLLGETDHSGKQGSRDFTAPFAFYFSRNRQTGKELRLQSRANRVRPRCRFFPAEAVLRDSEASFSVYQEPRILRSRNSGTREPQEKSKQWVC